MDDLISRQAAIDAINSHFGFNIEEEYGSAVQEVINSLPSAQPEIIWCKDCKWKQGIECGMFAEIYPRSDDFCSRGEKRTDE